MIPFRYDVKVEREVHCFRPDALAESKDQQNLLLTEIGAMTDFATLPTQHGRVVWECIFDLAAGGGAKIRPLKPKLWSVAVLNSCSDDDIYHLT